MQFNVSISNDDLSRGKELSINIETSPKNVFLGSPNSTVIKKNPVLISCKLLAMVIAHSIV